MSCDCPYPELCIFCKRIDKDKNKKKDDEKKDKKK